jgi:hypothetical protein
LGDNPIRSKVWCTGAATEWCRDGGLLGIHSMMWMEEFTLPRLGGYKNVRQGRGLTVYPLCTRHNYLQKYVRRLVGLARDAVEGQPPPAPAVPACHGHEIPLERLRHGPEPRVALRTTVVCAAQAAVMSTRRVMTIKHAQRQRQ